MPQSSKQTPTILIVDDRPENLLALHATLDDIDAQIIEALSGADALSCLLDNNVAMVLLDVQMPEMDGYEVASIMRETPTTASIPIVFLTAISKDELHIEKAYLSGAVDFITKPINTDILLAKVRVFLLLWAQSHELKVLAENYAAAVEEITLQRDQLQELAVKDHLTGLYQRRVFDEMMIKEISRSIRHQHYMSVAMLDLDYFKRVNDDYGHLVGDEVLIKTGQILMQMMRSDDLVCRFGGEEFVILMPNTQLKDAQVIAERIRSSIADTLFTTDKGELKITISIGLVEFYLGSVQSPQELLKVADDCLYKAKENGRNQVYPQSFEALT